MIHGIQYLMQFEMIVDDRCVKLMEELENYTWKKDKKTGEYMDEPVDSYNHAGSYTHLDVYKRQG